MRRICVTASLMAALAAPVAASDDEESKRFTLSVLTGVVTGPRRAPPTLVIGSAVNAQPAVNDGREAGEAMGLAAGVRLRRETYLELLGSLGRAQRLLDVSFSVRVPLTESRKIAAYGLIGGGLRSTEGPLTARLNLAAPGAPGGSGPTGARPAGNSASIEVVREPRSNRAAFHIGLGAGFKAAGIAVRPEVRTLLVEGSPSVHWLLGVHTDYKF